MVQADSAQREQPPRPRFLTIPRGVEWACLGGSLFFATVADPSKTGGKILIVVACLLVIVAATLSSRREYVQETASTRAEWRRSVAAAAAEQAERQAIEYREEYALTLQGAVRPIAELIGRIGTAGPAAIDPLKAQLQQMIVSAAASLCGPERSRATFFKLDDGILVPVATYGRGSMPRTMFSLATADGRQAHGLVQRGKLLYVPETQAPPPGVKIQADAEYRSFVAVSVSQETIAFGMVTIDALQPLAFDEGYRSLAWALAALLAAGLAIRDLSSR